MLWASILGMPFGLIDFFLIPAYWHPEVVFDLGIKNGFGLESFMFFSLIAGIASVIEEFIEKKKLIKIAEGKHHHFMILAFAIIFFIALGLTFSNHIIYNFIITLFIGSVALIFLRRDLLKDIILGGFIFAVFYLIIFVIINLLFPDFITTFYNLSDTWNILFVGVPIEEILAAFAGGMFWSALYKYVNAFSEK